jgi:hypothetical protein
MVLKNRLVTEDDGYQVVTAFLNGTVQVADNTHPNFQRILEAVQGDDVQVAIDLFDVAAAVEKAFDRLSERVTMRNRTVYFDGEPVHSVLTSQIVAFLDDDEDFGPLVAFMEKVAINPNPHSAEHLYRWIADQDLTITDDGDFIAYKGVYRDGDGFKSISSGTATVDGVVHNGQIPQQVGSVVEMPRGDVQFDPGVGCSTGLHAGTWEYASDFAQGATLTVRINPRDVVSVPTDCSDQKLRVCRYTVLDTTDGPLAYRVFHPVEVDFAPDDEEEDYDPWGNPWDEEDWDDSYADDEEDEDLWDEDDLDDDDEDEEYQPVFGGFLRLPEPPAPPAGYSLWGFRRSL